VEALIPARGALTFCFVDPYDIDFNFRQLARLTRSRRMDVLILLAVQMDARRNLATYVKQGNRKIARLLGRDDWREDWRAAEREAVPFGRWLTSAFTQSMLSIGYVRPKDTDIQTVTLKESSKVGLYYLAFYSKHERGYDFWRKALKYASEQTSLSLGF
jgi:three-Cys-motif partner protein